jgi:hypothetical protein
MIVFPAAQRIYSQCRLKTEGAVSNVLRLEEESMPMYLRYEGIDGSVQGASGGVWKTTNFLTSDPARGMIRLSKISLATAMDAVDAGDAMLTKKVERLFERARSGAPGGKIYVATDTGVFLNSVASGNRGKLIVSVDSVDRARKFDPQGRLIVGTDQGVWARSGEAAKAKSMNNLHQIGLAVHSLPTVEIFVSDARSMSGRTFRLRNVTITPSLSSFGRGQTLRLRFASVNN